jgi:hypothetical protein
LAILFVAISIAVPGCTSAATVDSSDVSVAPSTSESNGEVGSGTTVMSPTPSSDCDYAPGEPFIESDPVELAHLGEVNGVKVSGVVYPHPEYEEELWSQWGQGIALKDGRFFSAIGDHLGIDGNSYVYEYDPQDATLTMVGDVLSYVDHESGTWGYGKIHSQMVPGPCGEFYFSTYWGTYRDIEFEGNYTGDILFRLDPSERTFAPLGVPVEFHGQASLASHPESGLVFGEAIDPVLKNVDIDEGPFFAYDVVAGELAYTGPSQPHAGYRSILVDQNGRGMYSIGQGQMQVYDPATGDSTAHDSELPGESLRAVTNPAADGTVYGVTEDPNMFFAMHPDGSIDELGEALGYTASLALSADGSAFYYMPGAHGDAFNWGSPLIRVDTSTGEQTVVAELNEVVEESLGFTVGGTYNVALSPDGTTVYLGVNVGEVGNEDTFGEVVLLVVELS